MYSKVPFGLIFQICPTLVEIVEEKLNKEFLRASLSYVFQDDSANSLSVGFGNWESKIGP